MVINSINALGLYTQKVVYRCGVFTLFLHESVRSFLEHGVNTGKLLVQINYIGVNSLVVIMTTGLSVGAVLAMQTHIGLSRFGAFQFIGPVVFLGMVREFGPILSSIMVAGRAGSAMTAEIGTMQITEQIDALRTLGLNVKQYLIVPRIVASTISMPLISLFCSLCGILGGYIVAVGVLKVNHEIYISSIQENVVVNDILHGLVKSIVFGFLVGSIATFKGYQTRGGAREVGNSTTQSVVSASLATLIADYILVSIAKAL
ncbi:MAG: phospholipid/cholesterol/gamma-HCH transport system permease protein [Candidatus Dependentiae bacterium]|nr:phospholipid/cholesterol/gamma-HCH transport system permease protein [Candidatus Dependentiae bacterium]